MSTRAQSRRVQVIAGALAAVAADAEESAARHTPRPTTDEALYPAVYDAVAAEWGTSPAMVHLAHESAPIRGRLAYLADLGLHEGNKSLLYLCEEYCRRRRGSMGISP
jgi:hypothetical protein